MPESDKSACLRSYRKPGFVLVIGIAAVLYDQSCLMETSLHYIWNPTPKSHNAHICAFIMQTLPFTVMFAEKDAMAIVLASYVRTKKLCIASSHAHLTRCTANNTRASHINWVCA